MLPDRRTESPDETAAERLTRLEAELVRAVAERDEARSAASDAKRAGAQLLAAAAHDLTQPLQAARLTIGPLSKLQTDLRGKMLAGHVERALGSMSHILDAVTEIGRLDADGLDLHPEPVPLDPLFQSIASDFVPLVASKSLEIRIRSTDLVALSDAGGLRRVLLNLVSNAVRYTEKGGVLVSARPWRERIRIDVFDTGPGIPEEERELIFREFTRASAAEDVEQGLGLGLAIVRRLSEALDLDLTLRSRPGIGTCFSIYVEEWVRPR